MSKQLDSLYQNIRSLVLEARKRTYHVAKSVMIDTYWEVGRMIVEEEQDGKDRTDYGKQILRFLSERLTTDLGEGFDQSNLRYMRRVFNAFPIRDALRHELTWTHYRLISKVDNERARLFYIDEAIQSQWGTRTLERQIHSFYYERLLSSQQKKELIQETNAQAETLRPEDIIKDPYILEFLNLGNIPKLTEKGLETALIDKLQAFLLELGKGFAFVARQKRIPTENKNFYIDLVFYNILLKCSEKDEAVVKYSVLEDSQQLFASKYKLYLPSEEELARELKREVNELRLQMRLNQTDEEDTPQ